MSDLQAEARRVVDELCANGAALQYRPEMAGLLPSFIYELAAGGDRRRCRQIIDDVKFRPTLWRVVLEEIMARSEVRHD